MSNDRFLEMVDDFINQCNGSCSSVRFDYTDIVIDVAPCSVIISQHFA